jgi:ATP-binding cassette, subfamily B, bacterial
VLSGLNLTTPCGGSTAVVGVNGAGKSTLIKLLCRFYDPVRGVILWDGVDIRDVCVAELRERIGAVFQDYMAYDQPSSGLDAEGEHSIHRTLLEHRADTTSILISHRLNAVRHADLIAVLDDGRIQELGSHDRLVADGGEYARLFALQASGYTDPAPEAEPVAGRIS